jgi:hypothetical protein
LTSGSAFTLLFGFAFSFLSKIVLFLQEGHFFLSPFFLSSFAGMPFFKSECKDNCFIFIYQIYFSVFCYFSSPLFAPALWPLLFRGCKDKAYFSPFPNNWTNKLASFL